MPEGRCLSATAARCCSLAAPGHLKRHRSLFPSCAVVAVRCAFLSPFRSSLRGRAALVQRLSTPAPGADGRRAIVTFGSLADLQSRRADMAPRRGRRQREHVAGAQRGGRHTDTRARIHAAGGPARALDGAVVAAAVVHLAAVFGTRTNGMSVCLTGRRCSLAVLPPPPTAVVFPCSPLRLHRGTVRWT